MKHNNINYIKGLAVALAATASLASCNDDLDKLPDNRMELKSGEEVSSLLVSAYPREYAAYMLEMFSDNSDCYATVTSWNFESRFQEQAFLWQDITEVDSETPKSLWDTYYFAIASANQALEFLEGNNPEKNYPNQLSEALLCRAYSMYKLSEIFCQAYDPATADKNLGLPYPLKPETKIGETYVRGTLAELYQKIDADIQRALPYVHNNYQAVKYHFNQNAAYAFAARFYLNYRKFDKTIEYASMVLGDNPKLKLRDWAAFNVLSANDQIQPNDFVDSKKTCNLFMHTANSSWGVYGANYSVAQGACHGARIAEDETIESEGPWGKTDKTLGYTVFTNDALARHFVRNIPYAFEYTDIQAGIGYRHTINPDFTTDKLLMERAEAYALSGDYESAVQDLNFELSAFQVNGYKPLTLQEIVNFYNKLNYYTPRKATPKKKFNTTLVTDETTQEPLLQCILHLHRILSIHEGQRLQYVKRYGIEMYRRSVDKSHTVFFDNTDGYFTIGKDVYPCPVMKPNDLRLAIQLPADVITAGLEPNPRNK